MGLMVTFIGVARSERHEELIAHLGGFIYDSLDDPRLQYSIMEWPEHMDELSWATPPMALRNLLGLNDVVGQVMVVILAAQMRIELRRRQKQPGQAEERGLMETLPDMILSGLSDVILDPQEGGADASEPEAPDNPTIQ